ncbi:helix-turn-helix domain-containing protein [Burkholderia ambifaria]|uniref:helix-turn-helix domain-containing protein n=1 Tax=Burkholderia ambifaria TaxID=152480 RepID=UPI003CF39A01
MNGSDHERRLVVDVLRRLKVLRDTWRSADDSSYETISERTGISERDIRKAISLLIGTGLLVGINRDHSHVSTVNEPNKYYLTGYQALVQQKSGTPDGGTAVTPASTVAVAIT